MHFKMRRAFLDNSLLSTQSGGGMIHKEEQTVSSSSRWSVWNQT